MTDKELADLGASISAASLAADPVVPPVVDWRVRGEDLFLTDAKGRTTRRNVREVFGELVGHQLDDHQLAAILHALRLSLVEPGDHQRAMAAAERQLLALQKSTVSAVAAVAQSVADLRAVVELRKRGVE